MAKKIILVLTLLFSASAFHLNAQDVHDLNSPLYRYLDIWLERGYIDNLPPLRPYPLPVVREALKQVAQRGDAAARELAGDWLAQLEQTFTVRFHTGTAMRFEFEPQFYGGLYTDLLLAGWINEWISFSGELGGYLVYEDNGGVLPAWRPTPFDYVADWSDFSIGTVNFQVERGFTGLLTFGTADLYLQIGPARSAFGPFFDQSIVLGPQAPQAGQFSLVYRNDIFTFSAHFLGLTATDEYGEDSSPDKYLILHSLVFYPSSWLELGIFETMVWGGRFEPLYIMPFSLLFMTQVASGAGDNSLMGMSALVKLPSHLRLGLSLYIDDIHFNDLIRFHFDTKYKVALQVGLTWTPEYPIFQRLSLVYTLVTPYTYSHKSTYYDEAGYETMPNYVNYTHRGQNLGPSLDPNSDKWQLDLELAPLSGFTLSPLLVFIRHGNASEGTDKSDNPTGTIFDPGYFNGSATFQNSTEFLSQDVLEYILQIGCTAAYRIAAGRTRINLIFNYTLQLIINKNLIEGSTEVKNFLYFGADFLF